MHWKTDLSAFEKKQFCTPSTHQVAFWWQVQWMTFSTSGPGPGEMARQLSTCSSPQLGVRLHKPLPVHVAWAGLVSAVTAAVSYLQPCLVGQILFGYRHPPLWLSLPACYLGGTPHSSKTFPLKSSPPLTFTEPNFQHTAFLARSSSQTIAHTVS